ncbi:hypothetical protein V7161_30350, partial [Neobacillus drentensis]|uniref:lipopolysaccharide biosynthesis protein n=1 Tax=Neobacillus drentensis TaxID=220684 RepID=UPI0030014DCE
IITYLNAHKWSLINADQKGYILARTNLIFQVTTTMAKIIVLMLTQNYVIYLIIDLIIFMVQNIFNGKIVDKRYSYIKTKGKFKIDNETKQNLISNIKAMFLHNIGGYIVYGTDNILISSLIGVATVGLYSNYTMIINQLAALVSPIITGIGASIGNMMATESSEKSYNIFKVTYLMTFWIFSVSLIFLYNLLEPFISWWLGEKYLLDHVTFIVILINFYLAGMRIAIATYKNTAGLFVQDKYAPLIEAVINLVSSIFLAKYFGLVGIFLGTTISTIATIFWTQPCIVYKNLFKKSVSTYFIKYIFYAILTFITCFITSELCNYYVTGINFYSLITRGGICLILPNIIYLTLFYKSDEFEYIKRALASLLSALKFRFNLF